MNCPVSIATVPNEIAELLRTFASSVESSSAEWQGILDSFNDPTGGMGDYLLAFRLHFAAKITIK